MTIKRLKWIFLASLLGILVILEYTRFQLRPYLDSRAGNFLMDGMVAISLLFFFGAAFTVISRLEERLLRHNRELIALHRAALDIYGELALDTVLQKVVDQACQLLDARYGAISVIDSVGNIHEFLTSGITADHRRLIGSPPEGRGLLGVVLRSGQRLRIPDVERDPRAVGFPPHHPTMHSLLAVPILCKGPFRGNLYVAEKETGPEFSFEDEETLVRFATKASIAIDNAHLHQRLRTLAVAEERVRIAREMHDGMAQVLAYVNTKAQAVQAYLSKGETSRASAQLDQLAGAARDVYTDVREGILALRTTIDPGLCQGGLQQFVRRWQQQSGIETELSLDESVRLTPTAELQLLRIIQEALSNVRKHSGASLARVSAEAVDGRLIFIIEDDGAGFDPAARQPADFPRFGLAIMRERAESIGAEFALQSVPGRGTRIRIELPNAL